MKTRILTVAALLATSTSAYAVGLDRSGQSIGALFETGNHLEFSLGYTNPTVEGQTVAAFGGAPIGNVGDNFLIWSGAIKMDINEQLSFAVIVDEPYGADTFYGESPATSILGGTGATVDSFAVTALGRYKFNENWSIHGGIRYQEVSASVTLGGLAFNSPATPFTPSGVNGYEGNFSSGGGVGYVIGGAYEIPDIALRVALTYNSAIDYDLRTTESIRGAVIATGGTTAVRAPESVNLDFQTGIAQNTLLFGSIRWANYGQTEVTPAGFQGLTGNSLTDLENGVDINIGVGRRFNEKWSGSFAIGYSSEGEDDLVSPLAPTNGSYSVSVGAKYDVNENFAISGGVRYTNLGDAISAPGGRGVANFDGNDAVSVGVKFAYKF